MTTAEEKVIQDNEIEELSLEEENLIMPCIPLRGISVFPQTVAHFDVGREKSVKALEAAMKKDKILFVSSQKDEYILIPKEEDYYKVGTVVKIKQMLKIQGDSVRVLVEGLHRAAIKEVVSEEPYITVSIEEIPRNHVSEDDLETEAMKRIVLNSFNEYLDLNPNAKSDTYDMSVAFKDAEIFADTVAVQLDLDLEEKQEILETFDIKARLVLINTLIFRENQILRLEREISEKVQENVKQNQKEYYLREQLKAIQSELGADEDAADEARKWIEKLDELKLDDKITEKVKKEINKFTKMMPSSAESGVIRNYVDTIVSLPWNNSSKTNSDLKKAEKVLDEDHYGLSKVKERILEYLAVIHLSKGDRKSVV